AAHVLLGLAPVAGQRPDQLAVALALDLLQRPRPRRPAVAVGTVRLLLEAGKEMPPLVADRARVLLVERLQLLDIGGIGTMQERGARKGFVLRLAGHVRSMLGELSGSGTVA